MHNYRGTTHRSKCQNTIKYQISQGRQGTRHAADNLNSGSLRSSVAYTCVLLNHR
jgi:hypothetical protein